MVLDQCYEYVCDNVDFIKCYIFFGGFLLLVIVMCQVLCKNIMLMLVGLEDIGVYYGKIIVEWWVCFIGVLLCICELGFDECFCRMWDYYLCYCQGVFMECVISIVYLFVVGFDYWDGEGLNFGGVVFIQNDEVVVFGYGQCFVKINMV